MNILKFKMADVRRFKRYFLTITQQPIAQFQCNYEWGSSFSQNFGSGTDTGILYNVFFCFPNEVWLLVAEPFVLCPIHLFHKI